MYYPLLKETLNDTALIPLVKYMSQDKMDRFAVVAEGVGAIHVDPRFAEKTPFQSTIAHGFLFVAYISEMMENNFGISWLENGTIDMKNVGPVKPGDALLITGTIRKHEPEGKSQRLTCEVVVENQNRQKVAVGETTVLRASK